MIVLDSSVLVAIIKGEEGSEQLLDLLIAEDCAIGAPTRPAMVMPIVRVRSASSDTVRRLAAAVGWRGRRDAWTRSEAGISIDVSLRRAWTQSATVPGKAQHGVPASA